MLVIDSRNVHEALPEGVRAIEEGLKHGTVVRQDSRNGPVFRAATPVTTRYRRPAERVIFHSERDANPFFHFMEGLWMLAGRNDVEWISQFNKSFAQFSDDGETFHGAYGARWRQHWEILLQDKDSWQMDTIDQIETAVNLLKTNNLDRRVVIQMWDPRVDLAREGKDFPCNLTICVSVSVHGCLDMMVTCRSNDIVWGAYGANAVHMSMLQEYMAAAVGVPIGEYWQVSYNWHAYEETYQRVRPLSYAENRPNPYRHFNPFSMVNTDLRKWNEDLHVFIENGPIVGFRDAFFRRVATPIYHAWKAKEDKDDKNRWEKAYEIMEQCSAPDWKIACQEWIARRMK